MIQSNHTYDFKWSLLEEVWDLGRQKGTMADYLTHFYLSQHKQMLFKVSETILWPWQNNQRTFWSIPQIVVRIETIKQIHPAKRIKKRSEKQYLSCFILCRIGVYASKLMDKKQ